MSALADRAEEYLRIRRALGHKMAEAERLLPRFVAYLEAAGAETATVEMALAWATQPPGGGPTSTVWGRRMTVARGFARHLQALDPRTEVPPTGLLAPPTTHRAVPYLYSEADIAALMAAARALPSPLRAATYETLIGLLAVTGMRIGEAIPSTEATSTGAEARSWCVTPSSASPVCCLCGPARSMPWPATHAGATASAPCRPRLPSS